MRERNEDAAYVDDKRRFFIVADGMGGHSAGDVASALAVSTVRAELESDTLLLATFEAAPTERRRQQLRTLLARAANAANQAVLERSRREADKHRMGTTLEVVLVLAGEAFVCHVGDSRTYLIRDGAARQLTDDHTVAQVMRRAGTLSPAEADSSPMRSVLCNAIGVSPDVSVDHGHLVLHPGDRLLVCSDGLYDYFQPDELARWVSCHAGEAALAGLVAQACERGGADNITGIVVEVPAPSHAPELLDDAPTSPISLPPDTAPTPIVAVADDALSAFVEQALRESSGPHSAPRD